MERPIQQNAPSFLFISLKHAERRFNNRADECRYSLEENTERKN